MSLRAGAGEMFLDISNILVFSTGLLRSIIIWRLFNLVLVFCCSYYLIILIVLSSSRNITSVYYILPVYITLDISIYHQG